MLGGGSVRLAEHFQQETTSLLGLEELTRRRFDLVPLERRPPPPFPRRPFRRTASTSGGLRATRG